MLFEIPVSTRLGYFSSFGAVLNSDLNVLQDENSIKKRVLRMGTPSTFFSSPE